MTRYSFLRPAKCHPRARLLLAAALACFATLAAPLNVRADDNFDNIGNPTGNAGYFNGNVNSGGSYDPLTANATRTVTDLVVPGAVGSYGLSFARTTNSRFVGGLASFFGDGGNWRHNFQYELRAQGGGGGGLALTYPDGRNVTFNALATTESRYEAATIKPPATLFYGPPGTRDRLDTAPSAPVLLLTDGGQVHFESYTPPGGAPAFRPARITDPHGWDTLLAYWATDTDNLKKVTEPGGRWLHLDYLPPYDGAQRVTICAVRAWNEQRVVYHYGRHNPSSPYVVLKHAEYMAEPSTADPAMPVKATYEYFENTYSTAGPYGAPLLKRCQDPHFAGAMWGIFYTYDNSRNDLGGWGRVQREWHPTSGAWVSELTATDASGVPLRDEWGGKLRRETRGDRAEDGTGSVNPLVRSFGYWPTSNFLRYVTDYAGVREVRQYDNCGYLWTINDRRNFQTIFRNEPHIGQVKQITLPPDEFGISHSRKLDYSNNLYPYYVRTVSEQVGPNPDSTSADWRHTVYARDGRNRVTRVDHPDGGYETFTFDDTNPNNYGQVVTHRLTTGGTVTYAYGVRGLLASKTESDGAGWVATTTYAYDALDRLLRVTDDRQNRTEFTYNGRHQVVRVTHPQDPARQRYPDGQIGLNYSTATYDDQGNRLSTTNECGHTTTVQYDQYRRPLVVRDPLNHPVHFSYERRRKNGQVVANADTHTRGAWTTLMRPSYADGPRFKHAFRAFDPFGRVVSETTGLGGTDTNWSLVVSGGNSGRTDFTYDVTGNLTAVVEPVVNSIARLTSYTVDARGRRLTMTLPADGQHDRTYSYDYDGVGNLLQETRPVGGGRFLYAYDAMNRRTDRTDPANHLTRTVYDYKAGGGAKLTTTDPNNNPYVLHFDGLGRKVRMVYPGAGGQEEWRYDQAGNVNRFTNRAGQEQTLTYDNRNWLTQTAWNTGGRTVNTTLYADGRFLYASTSDGTEMTDWLDAAGRVTHHWHKLEAALPWAHTYHGYDDDNSRTQLNYPGGDVVLHRYNDRGQLGRVYINTDQFAHLDHGYSADGRPTVRYRVNGVHTFAYFDGGGRLGTLGHCFDNPHTPGNLRDWRDYGYDALTRRTWSFKHQDGRGDRYAYGVDDQLGLVHQEAIGAHTGNPHSALRETNQSHDPAGNRIIRDDPATGRITHGVDALNRYTTLNGAAVGYDANGNLTYDPLTGSTYTFDADNRLVRAVHPQTGTDRRFGYDALGRNVWRQDHGGAKTYLLYDGANLLEERGGPGGGGFATRTRRYVHGAGVDEPLVAIDANGGGFYYHQDANGNVVALTDWGSNVVERYRYDPFGRPIVCDGVGNENRGDTSLYGNRFLFTGREWQSSLKLYDYRARAYLPSIGRFLQPDPIGFAGGNHLYRYCDNEPVGRSDPSGLATLQVGGTLSGQGAGLDVGGSHGFVIDTSGNIGRYETGQIGVGIGSIYGLGISVAISNGGTIHDLSGDSWYGSASAGKGPNLSIDGFAGPGSQNQPVGGNGATLNYGPSTAVTATTGRATTTVTPITSIPAILQSVGRAISSFLDMLGDPPPGSIQNDPVVDHKTNGIWINYFMPSKSPATFFDQVGRGGHGSSTGVVKVSSSVPGLDTYGLGGGGKSPMKQIPVSQL